MRAMKKIKYVGPCPRVEVVPRDAAPFVAERGAPVEVPASVAESLLRQSTWESVEAETPKTTKEKKA